MSRLLVEGPAEIGRAGAIRTARSPAAPSSAAPALGTGKFKIADGLNSDNELPAAVGLCWQRPDRAVVARAGAGPTGQRRALPRPLQRGPDLPAGPRRGEGPGPVRRRALRGDGALPARDRVAARQE